jgi:hypothetical protein
MNLITESKSNQGMDARWPPWYTQPNPKGEGSPLDGGPEKITSLCNKLDWHGCHTRDVSRKNLTEGQLESHVKFLP